MNVVRENKTEKTKEQEHRKKQTEITKKEKHIRIRKPTQRTHFKK